MFTNFYYLYLLRYIQEKKDNNNIREEREINETMNVWILVLYYLK